jgi:hypothetical protein
MASLLRATNKAIRAAKHLTDLDSGAIESLREIARSIDAWDVIVEYALDDIAGKEHKNARPAVPQFDNTAWPTYLKYCEQLGLTPKGRKDLGVRVATEGDSGGKKGRLTALRGGAAAS